MLHNGEPVIHVIGTTVHRNSPFPRDFSDGTGWLISRVWHNTCNTGAPLKRGHHPWNFDGLGHLYNSNILTINGHHAGIRQHDRWDSSATQGPTSLGGAWYASMGSSRSRPSSLWAAAANVALREQPRRTDRVMVVALCRVTGSKVTPETQWLPRRFSPWVFKCYIIVKHGGGFVRTNPGWKLRSLYSHEWREGAIHGGKPVGVSTRSLWLRNLQIESGLSRFSIKAAGCLTLTCRNSLDSQAAFFEFPLCVDLVENEDVKLLSTHLQAHGGNSRWSNGYVPK